MLAALRRVVPFEAGWIGLLDPEYRTHVPLPLAPTLGHALDPMRSIVAGARLVGGATAGVVLARVGRPLPLPGLPAHPLLAAGSAVLAEVARQPADGGGWTQCLWPDPGPRALERSTQGDRPPMTGRPAPGRLSGIREPTEIVARR
ncbi:hypothetical protein ACI798_00845 [Geodermatophilus sp. SYSU D01045]